MVKYYVDTCIWRDYWEDRNDGLRPLGEFAYRFFMKAIKNKDIVLYSDLIIEELSNDFTPEVIKEMMAFVKPIKVDITDEHMKFASKLNLPKKDAIHTAIAIANDAVLVSRDKHLSEFCRRPEEL